MRGEIAMALVVSFVNQKGGCGKSTFTCALARYGKAHNLRVLLLDSDPQATTTEDWIADEYWDKRRYINLSAAIASKDLSKSIVPSYSDGIDLVPATIYLSEQRSMSTYTISDLLEPVKQEYDLIICDAPGSYDNFMQSVVTASDVVAIPYTRDRRVVEPSKITIDLLQRDLRHIMNQKRVMIFLNDILVRNNKRVKRITQEEIQEVFAPHILTHRIPENKDLADMANNDISISRAKAKVALFDALTTLFDDITGLSSAELQRF
jgi:chromosome partitioning protein